MNINEIIQLYKSGLGSTKIGKILGIPNHKIIYQLKKSGITLEGPKRNRIKTDDDQIVKYYMSGLSISNIAEKLNVSDVTILNRLKSSGVNRRKRGPLRSIEIDDHVFSTFTPSSCYWAGFIAADGCVYKNEISIHLHSCDVDHLYKFKQFVNFSGPVSRNKNQESNYIKFRSDKMAKDLHNNFNIVPCKSLILQPPKDMPIEFDVHFIRGYFDGDGCISKGSCVNFELYSGSPMLLEWAKNKIKIHNNLESNVNVRLKKGNCFRISFCGKQVRTIVRWLYESNSHDHLERKLKKSNILLEDL